MLGGLLRLSNTYERDISHLRVSSWLYFRVVKCKVAII